MMQVEPGAAYLFWADDHGLELIGGPCSAAPSLTSIANDVRLEPGKANLPHTPKNSEDTIFRYPAAVPSPTLTMIWRCRRSDK
jgi:hypothetical protein